MQFRRIDEKISTEMSDPPGAMGQAMYDPPKQAVCGRPNT
jgi:hypothetical protein